MIQEYKVHVSQPTEVILNGKITEIKADTYKINNLEFCNDNDFMKCDKCKEYFDETISVTIYHPLYLKCKGKDYCQHCFTTKIEK